MQGQTMPAPRKYPQELRDRAIRLVQEARQEESGLSVTAAVTRIGTKIGVNPDTLRGWVKQTDIDAGKSSRHDHRGREADQGTRA